MKRSKGRPQLKHPTVQIRVDEETAAVLKKLSGNAGLDMPTAMREWLLPLARAELARRMMSDLADMKHEAGKK